MPQRPLGDRAGGAQRRVSLAARAAQLRPVAAAAAARTLSVNLLPCSLWHQRWLAWSSAGHVMFRERERSRAGTAAPAAAGWCSGLLRVHACHVNFSRLPGVSLQAMCPCNLVGRSSWPPAGVPRRLVSGGGSNCKQGRPKVIPRHHPPWTLHQQQPWSLQGRAAAAPSPSLAAATRRCPSCAATAPSAGRRGCCWGAAGG